MKTILFMGDSRERIRDFPVAARYAIGRELFRVQQGLDPLDWKPMKEVGAGARSVRAYWWTVSRVLRYQHWQRLVCTACLPEKDAEGKLERYCFGAGTLQTNWRMK
jgi:phage-related protein